MIMFEQNNIEVIEMKYVLTGATRTGGSPPRVQVAVS